MTFKEKHEALKREILHKAEEWVARSDGDVLFEALKRRFPAMSLPISLGWIPEQGEDIFVVLVDCEQIATAEAPRPAKSPDDFEITVESVRDYKKYKPSKNQRRVLDAALELLKDIRRDEVKHGLSSRRGAGL